MKRHERQQGAVSALPPEDRPREGETDSSLVDRVAAIEAAVVDSCRKIEDQHLASASLRERLRQMDTSLHSSQDRAESLLNAPLRGPAGPGTPLDWRRATPDPELPDPAPIPVQDPAPPEVRTRAPVPALSVEARPREDAGRLPPALLLYVGLLAAGAVLPWIGGAWSSSRAARERAAELDAALLRPTPAPEPRAQAGAPLPLPDEGKERALRLVYAYTLPGRKETVFDLLLRSSRPNLEEKVERVDRDSYVVTLDAVRLGADESPARFEADLAEGTVSVLRDAAGETTAAGGGGTAPSGR
ncbi:MAG: hypothetical protein WC943_02755 [Elusimicrobiota bacterium]|jgi:hypothetical protein